MNAKISNTGFWDGENAHHHHVHSPKLAEWISDLLSGKFNIIDTSKSKRIYDFGAGLGFYLKQLDEDGFTNLVGFEGDPPKQKVFANIWKQDLTQPISDAEKGDVLLLEVGEHIPQEFESVLIDNVSRLCRGYLVLSWAVPGQAGYGHVNCKTNEDVIEMLRLNGFVYLPTLTEDARANVDDNAAWFRNTLMVFYK
jgi:hypothetical protein